MEAAVLHNKLNLTWSYKCYYAKHNKEFCVRTQLIPEIKLDQIMMNQRP